MNVQGNLYTFLFASIMVIIVAAGLSFTAITLQPLQEKNVQTEKIQNILTTVQIQSTVDNAKTLFAKYITKRVIINHKGEIVVEINGNFV